ncbi:MAG: hypothetical protein NZ820_08530 [Dehalococcoidia bacterium]|jgi:hypothetical protein|nr:hypothetical protein [Dehalococcoidia bacterium]
MPLFYDTWPLPQGHQRLSTVPKIIETGEFVALGTYFYQLQVGDHTETGKIVILK